MFVWGEKLGWPRTPFIILLTSRHKPAYSSRLWFFSSSQRSKIRRKSSIPQSSVYSPTSRLFPHLSPIQSTLCFSRGERGILAHPPTPPNFHEKFIFSHFFLPKPTETKITHPKSHFTYAIKHNFSLLISTQKTHTFLCMRSSRTLKKSHKIPSSFSIGGVGGFPPESPFLPY